MHHSVYSCSTNAPSLEHTREALSLIFKSKPQYIQNERISYIIFRSFFSPSRCVGEQLRDEFVNIHKGYPLQPKMLPSTYLNEFRDYLRAEKRAKERNKKKLSASHLLLVCRNPNPTFKQKAMPRVVAIHGATGSGLTIPLLHFDGIHKLRHSSHDQKRQIMNKLVNQHWYAPFNSTSETSV